jgi:iron complex outermembrane recepter protein
MAFKPICGSRRSSNISKTGKANSAIAFKPTTKLPPNIVQYNESASAEKRKLKGVEMKKLTMECSLAVLALALMPLPALAQTTPSNAEAPQVTEEEAVPGDIVVTATRRNQRLQDVGLSITALGGEQLEARGINSFVDYGSSIPNLSFGATGDGSLGSRAITIRGIQGLGTTGFYIDETPVVDSVDPRIVDLERIEVLRGPQGTLFGARSMGGTVRLITRQPDANEFEGWVHAGVSYVEEGNVNYLVDGSLNIPLVADRLAVRVLGFYQSESGIFEKAVGPQPGAPTLIRQNVDDLQAYGGQIALRWQPTDGISITPRVMYQRVSQDAFPFADNDPGNFTQRRTFDIREGGYDEWILYSLNASADLGFGTVTSATSYFDRKIPEQEDYTGFVQAAFGLATPLSSTINRDLRFRRFVQEIRFVSDLSGPFQFTIGGFYSKSADQNNFVPASIIPGLNAATGAGDLAFTTVNQLDTRELAVFGEATVEIADGLKLTAGLRYFDNQQSFRQRSDGIFSGGPVTVDRPATSENGFNPKFLVEYRVNPNVLVYATAARGNRVGGFNGNLPPACDADLAAIGRTRADTQSFGSDSLWSYEAGVKTTLDNGRATINGSYFYIDWSNVQQGIRLQCGFPFTGNAGAARSQGFELEFTARPTRGMTFGMNVGYANARITEQGRGSPQPADSPVYQVPRWTVSTNLEYATQLTNDFEIYGRGDLAFVDKSFSANNNPLVPRVRPDYTLVDLRAGVRNDQYDFTLFVRNLTNERANLADNRSLGAETPGLQRIVTNRPRTIGVEARVRF